MHTRFGAWALALLLAAPVAAGARTSGPDEHDHQNRKDGQQVVDAPAQVKTFNVGANGSLKLSNVAGDVRVTGGGGTEIKVEAVIHGKGKTDAEARAQFDSVKVDMRQNGSRVDVETTHERHSRAWVDYTVVVPNGTSIDVRSVSGDVFVSEIGGSARAETVSGDVTATGLAQVAALRSVSGDVHATGLSSNGAVSFNSVSGDVTDQDAQGRLGDVRDGQRRRARGRVRLRRRPVVVGERRRRLHRHARQGRPLRLQLALGRHRAGHAERLRAQRGDVQRRHPGRRPHRPGRDAIGRAAPVAARSAAAARWSKRRRSRATCASTARAELAARTALCSGRRPRAQRRFVTRHGDCDNARRRSFG